MVNSTTTDRDQGFWKRHLEKIGIGGSLFAALCCLGFPALISILSALGLSFIARDSVLMPLLLVFLIITIAGLYLGTRHHHQPWAFLLGVTSAVVTFIFVMIWSNRLVAWFGIAGLVLAGVLNVWLKTRQLKSS
jgi:mercuric ion transport protein